MSILSNEAVRGFLERHAGREAGAVAVFDCDGTLIKGDVGEAMLYYQIEHFLFRHSPAAVWPDHPRRQLLDELYRTLEQAPAGGRSRHEAFGPLADMILDWYFGQIEAGSVAKACADIVRLFAGFTPAEVQDIALRSYRNERAAPVGTRRLGRRTLPLGIRYIREAVDLLTALRQRGFAIWAVSGSNKWSVEPVFARFEVPPARIVGIELMTEQGVLVPEPVQPVPIRQGKVAAMQRHMPAVPVFAASDSQYDIPLLLYSSDLKVRINSRGRDTGEFFRAVGAPPDGSWLQVDPPTIIEDGEF